MSEPTRRLLRVERLTRLADGVVEILLADPEGVPLPSWEPGAHVAVVLPSGATRQYSLCGPPQDTTSWTIAVHRAPASRGGSSYLHESLRPGALLPVEDPRNLFPLGPADRHLLIAGGIGITPILAMARELRRREADFTLLYCGRSTGLMAYLDEVTGWEGDRVRVHADDEQGGPADLKAVLEEFAGATVHCCGPGPMLDAVERLAPPASTVRVERFQAAPAPSGRRADEPFAVRCGEDGERFTVGAGETLLDALERAGRAVPSTCREGICGTCETKVLRGVPDHRDSVLTDDERAANATLMVCVSRSTTPELVLDLP